MRQGSYDSHIKERLLHRVLALPPVITTSKCPLPGTHWAKWFSGIYNWKFLINTGRWKLFLPRCKGDKEEIKYIYGKKIHFLSDPLD